MQFIDDSIRRLGGVEHVTAANFPAANLRFGEDLPWRCVSTALGTLGFAGLMEIRVGNPGPAARAWADPLVFELDLSEDQARSARGASNRVGLNDRGRPTWNGVEIDLVTLRQYCDVTQTMNPLPWLILDLDEQAPYRDVGPILGTIWRARVEQIEISTPESRSSGRESILRMSAESLLR